MAVGGERGVRRRASRKRNSCNSTVSKMKARQRERKKEGERGVMTFPMLILQLNNNLSGGLT